MATDFSVTWQFLSKITFFSIMDQTPCPYPTRSLPAYYMYTFLGYEAHQYMSVPLGVKFVPREELGPQV
jgi:hypothetical protein